MGASQDKVKWLPAVIAGAVLGAIGASIAAVGVAIKLWRLSSVELFLVGLGVFLVGGSLELIRGARDIDKSMRKKLLIVAIVSIVLGILVLSVGLLVPHLSDEQTPHLEIKSVDLAEQKVTCRLDSKKLPVNVGVKVYIQTVQADGEVGYLLCNPRKGSSDPKGGGIWVVELDREVHFGGLEELSAFAILVESGSCLLYTSPSPRDRTRSRMPSSA